jgi:hypothetical protein
MSKKEQERLHSIKQIRASKQFYLDAEECVECKRLGSIELAAEIAWLNGEDYSTEKNEADLIIEFNMAYLALANHRKIHHKARVLGAADMSNEFTRIILPDGTGREVNCQKLFVGERIQPGDIKEWPALGNYTVYRVDHDRTYTSPAGNKSKPQTTVPITHVFVA